MDLANNAESKNILAIHETIEMRLRPSKMGPKQILKSIAVFEIPLGQGNS